jgi:hypothetical protein
MTLPWSMTATAMPLALVCAMIFPTSASIAAALGSDCATAAAGAQNTADNRTKSGRILFHILMSFLIELYPDAPALEQGQTGVGGITYSSLGKFELRPKLTDIVPEETRRFL